MKLKRITWEVQTGANTYPQGLLPLLSGCRKYKLALQSGHYWYRQQQTPTLPSLLHPPTTTYMPRSTCKQCNTYRCSLVRLGVGAGFLTLAGFFTSQCAQSSCQSALPAFIRWNSENIPLQGGLWCSFEQSIPKTSSVELPFSHGQSLPGQERSAGDRLHMRPQYPAAAFSTNSLFLLNMTHSNPRLR